MMIMITGSCKRRRLQSKREQLCRLCEGRRLAGGQPWRDRAPTEKGRQPITVDFVTYVPKWDDKLVVEGIPIEDYDGHSNANRKIIQTVNDNLDHMPHWTAELEDTGDDQFYRLAWAAGTKRGEPQIPAALSVSDGKPIEFRR